MYLSTQEFHARLRRLSSASTMPTQQLRNTECYADSKFEFYDPQVWNRRQAILALRDEIIAARRSTGDAVQRAELLSLERKIESALGHARKLKAKPSMSFQTVFMNIAEKTLNHDVFRRIKDLALQEYAEACRKVKNNDD